MDDAGLQESSAIDMGTGKPDGGIKVGNVGNSGGSAIDMRGAGDTNGGIKAGIVVVLQLICMRQAKLMVLQLAVWAIVTVLQLTWVRQARLMVMLKVALWVIMVSVPQKAQVG